MTNPFSKLFIARVEDCFGQWWNVVESRPTDHGWPVLLGYPDLKRKPGCLTGGSSKGGVKIIITTELRDYLERYRLRRAEIRLPPAAHRPDGHSAPALGAWHELCCRPQTLVE